MKEKQRVQKYSELSESRSYAYLQKLSDLMDRYFVDAALGFVLPGGIGDGIAAAVSVVYLAFSAFRIKSFALTMAVLNNTLRDVMLGIIPFHLGDVIDIFHRSNQQNMQLIRGFVEGDEETIAIVNRKAVWSVIACIIMCVLIAVVVHLVIGAAQWLLSLF